jgi:hypothetical protein
MTQGVLYLICGPKVAERLVVSVWSLRRFWDGSITVLCSTDAERDLLAPMAADLNVELQRIDVEDSPHKAYLAKSRLHDWTPYDDNVFIDADTLVVGEIDELFGYPLTLTPNSDWVTTGKRMRRWLKQWYTLDNPAIDALVDAQLGKAYPAINIGVFGFQKDNPNLADWHWLTQQFPEAPLPEQIAMQLLISTIKYHRADQRFNRLAVIGHAVDDIRIWHFHGLRHCSKQTNCREIWIPAFREAMARNIGKLQSWAGQYDRQVRRLLNA